VTRFHAVTAEAEERDLEFPAQGAARSMAHRRRGPAVAALQDEVKRFCRMTLASRRSAGSEQRQYFIHPCCARRRQLANPTSIDILLPTAKTLQLRRAKAAKVRYGFSAALHRRQMG
jgi:hypothetical protein